MSREDEILQENSTEQTEDYTLMEELTEEPEALPVILNDDQGNELQAVLLGDHELLGATLTSVTLPDGTQGFLANHRSASDEEQTEEADITPRSILIRDCSTLEPKMIRLEVSPLVVHSQPSTSESSNPSENLYAEIQIINGSAYMVARPKPAFEKSKKKENKPSVPDSESRAKFSCPWEGCHKVYTTPHHLKVHERSHTGVRPYECDFPTCNKSFSTGYSLKAHQRTHTGEKPYKCTAVGCAKSFKTSGDLQKHYRTHTGERPFVCFFEGCDRAFTTGNIRKVHMRTHTGERPYKCNSCCKAFASATNHKNHMRIHSQEKPYICMVENCGRAFTEYSSLYKHRLVHTAAKPFECKLCQKSYRQHSTLIMHKRTVHALIESEDGDDVYLDIEEIDEEEEEEEEDEENVGEKRTKVIGGAEASSDNETQILLVGDPKQIAALQQINLEEFHNSPIDTSLEGLNIKIEGMEFGWN